MPDVKTPLILYGAGNNAACALWKMKRAATVENGGVVCFCDGDSRKWGTVCCGLPVFSLEQIRETYHRVHRRDAFEQVCANMRRYGENGNVDLKYITIPENCTEADAEGFCKLVKEVSPMTVSLAGDLFAASAGIPETVLEFAVSLGRRLKADGYQPIVYETFGMENAERVRSQIGVC